MEMQIKTTMNYHFTPVRMAVNKKKKINAGEGVEKKRTLPSSKTKVDPAYDPAIPLLDIYPKKMKSLYERYTYFHVHCTLFTRTKILYMNTM